MVSTRNLALELASMSHCMVHCMPRMDHESGKWELRSGRSDHEISISIVRDPRQMGRRQNGRLD
jgi:hypothetical protein